MHSFKEEDTCKRPKFQQTFCAPWTPSLFCISFVDLVSRLLEGGAMNQIVVVLLKQIEELIGREVKNLPIRIR